MIRTVSVAVMIVAVRRAAAAENRAADQQQAGQNQSQITCHGDLLETALFEAVSGMGTAVERNGRFRAGRAPKTFCFRVLQAPEIGKRGENTA